jgi:tripartite-type tricarboxylate transporter receptor subunit TctC
MNRGLKVCALAAGVVGAAAMAVSGGAAAQERFPSKTIRLVLPFPAGSGSDLTFRPVVEHMTKTLGVSVVLDPRPGGGGNVSALYVRSQAPDGYTFYSASNINVVRSLGKDPQYDIRKDFTPIAPSNIAPMLILVNPEQINARTVPELIAEAKSRPGKIDYASYGVGSGSHMFFELLKYEAKISMLHIPYQGTAQAAADTAAGRTQVTGTILATARPFLSEFGGSGKLRLIGQSLADRTKLLPNTPGMKESGFPNIDYGLWGGYMGPPGMQKDVVDVLNKAINTALTDPQLLEIYTRLGLVAIGGTPQDLTRMIEREYNAYARLIKETGLKLNEE